jgi:NAD(P)H-dependent flavin oxidoreductase YrpB (nitropropane dioxygenase family)
MKPDAPPVLPPPYQMLLSSDYIQGANDARRPDLMTEAAGQGVALLRERRPTAEILTEMAAEARSTLQRLRG